MGQIELLYIKFLKHPFLEGLELNFSQEYEFRVTNDNKLVIKKLDSIGMFNNAITNLNIIVGKNGVGKTTILNEIFNLLHGSIQKDKVVAIRKNKTVYFYFDNIKTKDNILDSDEFLREYKFKIKTDGFYLEPHYNSKSALKPEIKNLIYISEFTDSSMNSSIHNYNNNFGFNYSPLVLINSPEYFFNHSNQTASNLQKTVSNYRLINKIHQIEFLAVNKFELNFRAPDSIQLNFNSFISRIERKYKTKEKKKRNELDQLIINMVEQANENSLKHVFKIHLILALFNLLDITRFLYDEQKALKELDNKIKKSELEEYWSNDLQEYRQGVISILTSFSLGNISSEDIFREYLELVDRTMITNYYSSENSESIYLAEEVLKLINVYKNLLSTSDNKRREGSSTGLTLNLKEAANFFRNYLIIRNYTEVQNEISSCMPDEINYFYKDEQFYFSSGEEQLIKLFTYINLSVKHAKNNVNDRENSFIILIDEPGNAFHPEMQKKFINYLNNFLNNFHQSKFHIILTSHSPIITSDLTKNHVLFLEKDSKNHSIRSLDDSNKPNTFAQNIYNLYKESFYIKEGLIGSYAEKVLSEIYRQLVEEKATHPERIDFLNREGMNKQQDESKENNSKHVKSSEYTYSDKEINFFIREIGEPILKKKFEEMVTPINKKDLLREIIEEHELPYDLKKSLISLIIKDEEF
ncbi:hypothetical protein JMA_09110 [Jeotgalibacillus malaysiensis]|uniref:AAA+ ATPase domain-containing protein n=1 Tax=Jeotgalibacillus malaysiensis TaxID=1508404 RepID=A0A0B5ANW2_9BACL|nr:AAA family ATPase [Jeotgalibacillus malaysiensis]AJD90228.1 hypothetical protein JMA_09110 [Jeotgalibacillus malaysiensis]